MQLPITTVSLKQNLSIRRLLPTPGEVLVQVGQPVEALTVVAQAEIPSQYRVIDLVRHFGHSDFEMADVLRVGDGEPVKAHQTIAALQGGVSFLQRSARAPMAGTVAAIGPGWVLLETKRTKVEIQAFINGVVTRILGNRGVMIEAEGALIEAACGFGGEAVGRLKRLVNSPYEAVTAEAIGEDVSEAIILGGRTVDEETLRKAETWKVRGIVVGSIEAELLQLDPPPRVRVVATEGFGNFPMSAYTFGILTSLSRKSVSIRGQTPHLIPPANELLKDEPPVIMAAESRRSKNMVSATQPAEKPSPVTVGDRVRVIQGENLGVSGTIDAIPEEAQITSSGIIAPGAYVKFNNDTAFIPWANLERVG